MCFLKQRIIKRDKRRVALFKALVGTADVGNKHRVYATPNIIDVSQNIPIIIRLVPEIINQKLKVV